MDVLYPERRMIGCRVVCFLVATAAASFAVAAGTDGNKKPINRRDAAITLDAASSEVDYPSNKYLFRSVTIRQGDLRVVANEARATGTDFDNATWEFKGKVEITMPTGRLRSDLAHVEFRNNTIASVRIVGQPAEFEQRRANNPEPARGRAGSINYDVATNLVRLTTNAWLSDGRNEIQSTELVYSLTDQKVRAQSKPGDGSGGIRITIRPSSGRQP